MKPTQIVVVEPPARPERASDPVSIVLPHTYVWTNTIGLISGATNYIPPFTIPTLSGQSAAIIGVRFSIRTPSDSLTFKIQCDPNTGDANDAGFADIPGLTNLVATSTALSVALSQFFEIGEDYDFKVVPTAIGTAPDGFRCTFKVNYQLT